VTFWVRHLGVAKVRGRFNRFDAALQVGDNAENSSLTAVIEIASLDTNNADRDGHVLSSDLLDVANRPELRFQSSRITGFGSEWRGGGEAALGDVGQRFTFDVVFGGIADFMGTARRVLRRRRVPPGRLRPDLQWPRDWHLPEWSISTSSWSWSRPPTDASRFDPSSGSGFRRYRAMTRWKKAVAAEGQAQLVGGDLPVMRHWDSRSLRRLAKGAGHLTEHLGQQTAGALDGIERLVHEPHLEGVPPSVRAGVEQQGPVLLDQLCTAGGG